MLEKILEDREKRYNKIIDAINKFKVPVICGKINYPGPDKNTKEAKAAFGVLLKLIEEEFAPFSIFSEMIEGFDGSAVIAAVNINSLKAKEIAVRVENNNPVGRIFDIDVYDLKGYPVSRNLTDKRKCILCGKDARECIRQHRHDISIVVNATNDLIRKNIEF